jgi:hypothetical protein
MKKLLLVALLPLVGLAGCAVPSTGVVPLADGLRKVTRSTNAGAFYSPEQLKLEAVQEATAACRKEGKMYRLVDITQRPPRPFGGWPEAEVLFKCDGGMSEAVGSTMNF